MRNALPGRLVFLALLPLLAGLFAACQAGASRSGPPDPRVQFRFAAWDGPPLEVYGIEPANAGRNAPVVIVLHGTNRNGDEYRDNWVDLAMTHGLNVYAPTFDTRRFAGAENYNLGGLAAPGPGAFDAIEPLYAYLRDRRGASARGYFLFGHSAGAQFVHRFTCFADTANLRLAIAANAGWYTRPDPGVAWPYGFAGAPTPPCELSDWFATPMLVSLGKRDTDRQHKYLRRTPEAMQQGVHRFARGTYFFSLAEDLAARQGLVLNWRLQVVEGVGHDNSGMAHAAVESILAFAGLERGENQTGSDHDR